MGNPSGLALFTMAALAVFGLLGLIGVFAADGAGWKVFYLAVLLMAIGFIWREGTQVLVQDDRLKIRRLLRVRSIPLEHIRGWTVSRQGIARHLYCPEIRLEDGTKVRLDSLRSASASGASSEARRVLAGLQEIASDSTTN
ncbi:MAG: hypothetical protein GY701_32120 [Sulfitobacter sp.]|nr:hypothetical protein [Sulfitobacter sp.]